MEDFSLNLICKGKNHLLPLTLDSLSAQGEGSFEVILLDGEGTEKLQQFEKQYKRLKIRIETGKGKSLPQLMNLGLSHSHGKYVQFLHPGETYLSQRGLSYLTELISTAPFLILAKGVQDETQSHWFLKSKLLEMGGFNERVHHRPLFDLLCRLQKQGVEPLCSSRVLIDAGKEPRGSPIETYQIIYRNFGFAHALKWMFLRPLKNFRRAADSFKSVFWRD